MTLSKFLKTQDINYAIIIEKFKFSFKNEEKLNQEAYTSIPANDKKMEYGSFLIQMIEKLEMQNQPDLLNDLLFKVFSVLNDEELNCLLKNPELILNFIHNDMNLFNLENETKNNKGKESI